MRICCAVLLLFVGCARRPALVTPPPTEVAAAHARPVPAQLQARFHFKVRSARLDLAGSTGGGLIVDRPGRGNLAIFGPLGAPLLTVQTDGVGLAVLTRQDRRHLLAEDAEEVLREVTGGVAGLDEILGLLVGVLPLEGSAVQSQRRVEQGGVQVSLAGPNDTAVVALLDPATATLSSLQARDAAGEVVLTAVYAPFAALDDDGPLMPTEVSLTVPSLDLELNLRFKSWRALDEVPAVFALNPPPGFTTEPLMDALLSLPPRP